MAKKLTLPDLDLLNHLFLVDESSPSGLRWKNPRTKSLKAGDVAGKQRKDGYWSVVITTDKKRNYYVHRIIFFMLEGRDPLDQEVDHVDGVTVSNIRVRAATRQQNAANTRSKNFIGQRKSSSIYKGVYKQTNRRKWAAQICINGKSKHLGSFDTEVEAANAYNQAALEAWGEYAKINPTDRVE